MDTLGAIFASLFGSVTARTAGFNTVDTAALTQESKLLTIVLMFIGGSPVRQPAESKPQPWRS